MMKVRKKAMMLTIAIWMGAWTVGAQELHEASIEATNIRVDSCSSKINALSQENNQLEAKLDKLTKQNDDLKREVGVLTTRLTVVEVKLDSAISVLNEQFDAKITSVEEATKGLSTKIESTAIDVNDNKEHFRSMTLYGVLGLLLMIAVAAGVFLALRKRIGDGISDMKEVQNANSKLQEQTVALDNRMAEILERQLKTDESVRQLSTTSSKGTNGEEDHSLALSIANELMRIEQNLANMDVNTKGVKQLKNRAAAIISLLKSKGYEMPSYVGTEYKESMNVEPTMEEDETFDCDKMIIKRVTRPCVMYNGKMIQCAQVVVVFNPDRQQ